MIYSPRPPARLTLLKHKFRNGNTHLTMADLLCASLPSQFVCPHDTGCGSLGKINEGQHEPDKL